MVSSADETTLTPPIYAEREVLSLAQASRKLLGTRGYQAYVGVAGSGAPLFARSILAEGAKNLVYVAADADAARRATRDLEGYLRGIPGLKLAALEPSSPLLITASDTTPYAEAHADRRSSMVRAASLFHIAAGQPWRVTVVTATALLRRVPAPRSFVKLGQKLTLEQEIDVGQLSRELSQTGYLRAPVVEDPGSFAVRGGIIDVWPAHTELPFRIELYGDMVLGIRTFDAESQRTESEVQEIWLPPAREAACSDADQARVRDTLRGLCDAVNYPTSKARNFVEDVLSGRNFFGMDGYLPAFAEAVPLLAYFPPEVPIVIEEPAQVLSQLRDELTRAAEGEKSRAEQPHYPVAALYVSAEELEADFTARSVALVQRTGISGSAQEPLSTLEIAPPNAPALAIEDHADLERDVEKNRAEKGKKAGIEPLLHKIAQWQDAGLKVVICARSELQAERLGTLLSHRSVKILQKAELGDAARTAAVQLINAPFARGACVWAEGFVLVTDEEIFGQRAARPRAPKRATRGLLEDLRALEPGDYVVHVDHGIGRYLGLERRQVGPVHVDLLVIEYDGGKLFLPIYRLNQVQKYSGGDGKPKLDRMGGQSFAKTKAKVQRHVRQMADELLKLYAERNAARKEPISPGNDDYAAFEASFQFEETRDQASAIAEVISDLQSERAMDRLVCGDVGFGKTEVALRAAFLNAIHGRQVAFLCPTTVLAQQHFLTCSTRFQGFPLNVRSLSRFDSRADQIETLKGLKEGSVDVVVGTHRVLSKDVHFKNLGLLVVDEEQRFGVTHKERLKQIRKSVDVLTLSATPIPRTLQLAVGGLRDMSTINTPPVDRRAVRTIVSQFDPSLVKEAVERELSRGGQIFYVYNRVEGIYERAERLSALVPSARIAVGHGQLSEEALEQTMLDFVAGKFDILVATAIIESGLDIPRANTIIIDRADLFGLSQLYQLRGRVGRASERAYAYLLVPAPTQMSDEARARIEALERHTELGSGFQIAALDMELRGTGDLLGGEQSGFAASVGFDLFCQMLQEATHELRGEIVIPEVDPELSFDVEALLPDDYISEVGVRLSLYKRLASALEEAEVAELAQEMEDRFGPPGLEAKRLVELMRLKTELRKLRVLGCEATAKSVTLHLRDDTPLDPQKIGLLIAQKKSPYRLSPDGRLSRRLLDTEAAADGLVLADRMLDELAKCLKN